MSDEARTNGAARCILDVRRMMRETISAELMLNPAVDMLLTLYLSPQASLSWDEVCRATRSTGDTCRRWGRTLAERGLIDTDDRGCRLTEEGSRTMTEVSQRVLQIVAEHLTDTFRVRPVGSE